MPQSPATAWTLMAPTGSSIPDRSQNNTLQTTSRPAMAPMTKAMGGLMKAQGAVMATRPPSMPLHIIEGSGLPYSFHMYKAETSVLAPEASMVLTAMRPIQPLVPERVEPALKPNQPKASRRVPNMTMGMWWPKMGRGLPWGSYLPRRGPSIQAMTSDRVPPWRWTTEEPAKSTAPCPRPALRPSWASQPPPHIQQP